VGADYFAALLGHPIAIALGIGVIFALSSVHYRNGDIHPLKAPRRLFVGYVAALLACIAIAAVSSYVPQDQAFSKWHVTPERYWDVQFNEFVLELVFFAWISLIGIAVVGLPIIFALGRRGYATVPWILAASLAISLFLAVAISAADRPANRHLDYWVAFVAGTHLLLSLSFCLGAGLPWKPRTK